MSLTRLETFLSARSKRSEGCTHTREMIMVAAVSFVFAHTRLRVGLASTPKRSLFELFCFRALWARAKNLRTLRLSERWRTLVKKVCFAHLAKDGIKLGFLFSHMSQIPIQSQIREITERTCLRPAQTLRSIWNDWNMWFLVILRNRALSLFYQSETGKRMAIQPCSIKLICRPFTSYLVPTKITTTH